MRGRFFLVSFFCILLFACRSAAPSYPGGGVYHTVQRHQTLWRICKTYGVDMREVGRINHIKDPSRIRVGQRIFIPGARRVMKVDIYIDDIGGRKGRPEDPKTLSLARGRFIWPLRGKVTREFGVRGTTKHDGIDISAPRGTPIRAAESGKVLYSGNEIRDYGNIIILKHKDGFISIYAHNETNAIGEGENVVKGQIIGRVGMTGRATGSTNGPNLHFEIRKNNRPINPHLVLD